MTISYKELDKLIKKYGNKAYIVEVLEKEKGANND